MLVTVWLKHWNLLLKNWALGKYWNSKRKIIQCQKDVKYSVNILIYSSATFTLIFRRPYVFCKNVVLRNFVKSTEKPLCWSLLFNKVLGIRPATALKKILWQRCFPVNFRKFLRRSFLTEHIWWLFMHLYLLMHLYQHICLCSIYLSIYMCVLILGYFQVRKFLKK